MTPRRSALWLAVAAGVLAALVFVPALRGPWIFDDHPLIEGNRQLHSLGNAGAWFTHDFWHGAGLANNLHYWRPLVSASYALDWSLGGGSPLQFHLTNIALHAAVAVLVLFTLRRWTGSLPAAFAAALVWAVHPTKAESVAWISGRTDLLCTAFVLVAAAGIACRLRGARTAGLVLEVLGTAGAYLSKELAVVLPMLAAVEVWVAAGRPSLDRASGRALGRLLVRAVAPQIAVAVAYLAARAVWLPIGGAASTLGLVGHARAVLDTYGRYLALVLAPHQLSMQHALVRPHDGAIHDSLAYVALGGAALAATLATAVALRKRFPAASVGLAMFLVTLAPTLNLVPSGLQTLVAERFLYLPTLGLALIVAALLAAVPAASVRRVQLVVAALAVALVAQALSRAADFSDEDQFWTRELALHPDSPAALDYAISTPMTAYVLEQIADADHRAADRATFAADVLDLFVRTTTDRDPAVLRILDRQAATLLAQRAPRTSLGVGGVAVAIDMTGSYTVQLPRVAARIYAARAELAGRGGDPIAARAAADAAVRTCGGCEQARAALALAEARAAAFGQPALPADAPTSAAAARASELAKLGLWGAAYHAVQPRFDELTARPADALALARLAFHAGRTVDAVDALASAVPTAQMRGTLEAWARDFGWLGPAATSADGPSSP